MIVDTTIYENVVELAKISSEKYDICYPNGSSFSSDKMDDFFNSMATPEYKRYEEARKDLKDYLLSLSFDDVKKLQALMYLGRDEDYDQDDSYNERFQKIYDDLDSRWWREKEIEIKQMVEKLPLAEDLRNGWDIIHGEEK